MQLITLCHIPLESPPGNQVRRLAVREGQRRAQRSPLAGLRGWTCP
ncbi:hypothetical protein [Leptolyngbya sp. GB2-A1]